MRKTIKMQEKSKKYAKKFAYIKKLYYLCTEIKKQDGAATHNSGIKTMATATYAKYCPNVFVAKCTEQHAKGDIITITTKYGKENECEVWNLVAQKDGFYYYSITRTDGYNCQERARRIADRLETSAASANAQSDAYAQKSHDYVAGIVPGQPILIGHHSERHHRRAIENSNRAMGKAVELSQKADTYESRAAYWKERAKVVNLSMPDSIEFYAFKVEQLEREHQFLKVHPEARPHAFALTYAKKDLNEARNNYQIALKLWGDNSDK